MRGGAKFLCFAAVLGTAGCTADSGELKIRPIADPSAKIRPGADRLADARGELALGNVGLAAEAFRKALREQPDDVNAYAGLAACYDAMGRYDLSRQYYESALALAPRSPALLNALAASLDKQGLREAAAEVRAEVADLTAASAALEQIQPEPAAAPLMAKSEPAPFVVRSEPASVTVALPPAQLVSRGVTADLPSFQEPSASVTVALPPARPVGPSKVVPAVALPAPNLSAQAKVDVQSELGPRLIRLSLGEVALITDNRPAWQPRVVARTAQSTTVRWVPLRNATASARPNIRLLNAARYQGLAAQTRTVLLDRGWRLIEIGDAAQTRATSLVVYPASRQMLGRSLAAQFGFRSAVTGKSDQLVILLGRDATAIRAGRARG
ncbi:MAG: LytR C-terminal domain-containing protein [Sphingomicrobium sp.]